MVTALGGRFGYFLLFSARGRGRGSPRRREGRGGDFLWKIPEGKGSPGWVGPGEGGIRGGGVNIFFGAEMSTESILEVLKALLCLRIAVSESCDASLRCDILLQPPRSESRGIQGFLLRWDQNKRFV